MSTAVAPPPGPDPEPRGMASANSPMSTAVAPPPGPDYHLETYKMLAEMYKLGESTFWTRSQMLLVLNTGLATIFLGILSLESKQSSPATPTTTVPSQSVPSPPAGSSASITVQQIDGQPAPAGLRPTFRGWPLVVICIIGCLESFIWTLLIKRSQGENDHFVCHMKYLEEKHLPDITYMRMYDKLFTKEIEKAKRRFPNFLWDTMLVDELTIATTSGKLEHDRLPRWGTFLRIYNVWVGIAFLFSAMWLALGLWIWFAR